MSKSNLEWDSPRLKSKNLRVSQSPITGLWVAIAFY